MTPFLPLSPTVVCGVHVAGQCAAYFRDAPRRPESSGFKNIKDEQIVLCRDPGRLGDESEEK